MIHFGECVAWLHQFCALFNGLWIDDEEQKAESTDPSCTEEIEQGKRKPYLGAKDLPRTMLSDHIERRLFQNLKQERQDRARQQGKSYDEVPGAEALVVRVVSSVDKKLVVERWFPEIFQEGSYPSEFPYKSKVLLLFQKIERIEVCLFGMYIQEFGSECSFPNERRVFISYVDSLEYFQPEVEAVTGEPLRTFVYHDILIGYLEYCKKRGFTSCYIWACPQLKGEDCIMHRHQEFQETPKCDKLREWYLAMLRKAAKEQIVVETTNLFDHFFVSTGECKAKVTAARLPYFDGDFWPGAAEDLIKKLRQASDQSDISADVSMDLLLMHKLGETISPMKENFIMAHLQHCCNHCCILMVSGNRWVCNHCRNFQICDKCYEVKQKHEERECHPLNHRDKHALYPVEITDVPADTKDKDEIIESEHFDCKVALSRVSRRCDQNFDTLSKAKHSSKFFLFHLHNPTTPLLVVACKICHLDVGAGERWLCETCANYDVCNSCYQKDGAMDHPHKLTNGGDICAQTIEARQQRFQMHRTVLNLLVHSTQCHFGQCQYLNCRNFKCNIRHALQCETGLPGGCITCHRLWYLLHLHAQTCLESKCGVPRCRSIKKHIRELQKCDARRRASAMEMMLGN